MFLSPRPIGRLAPSPTGAQHVGNARTYLLAWLAIRAQGGKLILRMEDIDSPRVKVGAAQQALDDLRWLGLDWDEGPDIGGPNEPYVQTARTMFYQQVLFELQQAELVYPCTCTRSDVQAAASAPHVGDEGPAYAGTCSYRCVADAALLGTKPFCWRFRSCGILRIDQKRGQSEQAKGNELLAFEDLVRGRLTQDVNLLGDFVVAKGDGSTAYQMAVVVDDHAMGVTDVLRGDDLIPSTFRQLQIYAALGWQPPRFAHVPLVIGADGRRLAKRHGDTRLSVLRAAGVESEKLIGLLAWSCRLRPSATNCSPRELLENFQLCHLPRDPWVFTPELWDGLLG